MVLALLGFIFSEIIDASFAAESVTVVGPAISVVVVVEVVVLVVVVVARVVVVLVVLVVVNRVVLVVGFVVVVVVVARVVVVEGFVVVVVLVVVNRVVLVVGFVVVVVEVVVVARVVVVVCFVVVVVVMVVVVVVTVVGRGAAYAMPVMRPVVPSVSAGCVAGLLKAPVLGSTAKVVILRLSPFAAKRNVPAGLSAKASVHVPPLGNTPLNSSVVASPLPVIS